MPLKEDLATEVNGIVRSTWTTRVGRVVPDADDLGLGNDAINLDAAVLYADMRGSTSLVDTRSPKVAAEVYKSYLTCAARIIRSEAGSITAYDGDRVMGVFIGDGKERCAVRAAMKINWAVRHIVNPALNGFYGQNAYQMAHKVGVDTSPILVARIGVRRDNDLVWVGKAANHAAKLTEINQEPTIFITDSVFQRLDQATWYGAPPNEHQIMWQTWQWGEMDNRTIYSSTWEWAL